MPAVDLTNLREMTGGDAEIEKALFEEFFLAFTAGIQALEASTANQSEVWRAQAHALKGIALNLGAQKLAELCKKAQDGHLESAQFKMELLQQIREEYIQVQNYLKQM